jgi:2-polyprenyl-3-methyl-5-hydroxy-6-metoxy-1,4-benzoquinol methylase
VVCRELVTHQKPFKGKGIVEMNKTKEPQYQGQVELKAEQGRAELGMKTSHTWHIDPKRLVFSLARYKFASKMLSGKKRVFEIGCGDAFCSRLILQEVDELLVTDFDPVFLQDIEERMDEAWPLSVKQHDFTLGPLSDQFDAAYSMDVIEHIPKEKTRTFLGNICKSLKQNGVLVIGEPSSSSQRHASENSKIGHVNCMDGPVLKALMSEFFENVFMFCMNDETLHTGFFPMAQYVFAVGSGVKAVDAE